MVILTRTNRRLYEVELKPPTFTVIDVSQGNAVSLRVTQQLVRQVVVDGSGTVRSVRELDAPTTSYLVLMVKQNDSRWYLMSVLEQGRGV